MIYSLRNTTRLCPTFISSGAFFVHGFGNAPLENFEKMHQKDKNPNLITFPSTRVCPGWCISCSILHGFVRSLYTGLSQMPIFTSQPLPGCCLQSDHFDIYPQKLPINITVLANYLSPTSEIVRFLVQNELRGAQLCPVYDTLVHVFDYFFQKMHHHETGLSEYAIFNGKQQLNEHQCFSKVVNHGYLPLKCTTSRKMVHFCRISFSSWCILL